MRLRWYNVDWPVSLSLLSHLLSQFLAFDTQLLMGNKQYAMSPEEYIFATLSLYLDIVYLFTFLLQLFGNGREWAWLCCNNVHHAILIANVSNCSATSTFLVAFYLLLGLKNINSIWMFSQVLKYALVLFKGQSWKLFTWLTKSFWLYLVAPKHVQGLILK